MRKTVSKVRAAVEKYDMINEGDRISVGVSGGKDSVVLLSSLAELRRFYPHKFELEAITLDPQFGGTPGDYSQIRELCKRLHVNYTVKRTDLWQIIFEIRKESNPCSLCARMRRGALHDLSKELGCNKIALGHHMDDAVETFYMNIFNGGRIASFSPVTYLSRKDLYMIRPLIFLTENETSSAAKRLNLPVVKSKCPADGVTERENVKSLLKRLEADYPDIKEKTVSAMQRSCISGW